MNILPFKIEPLARQRVAARSAIVKSALLMMAAMFAGSEPADARTRTGREGPVLISPMPLQADGCYYYRGRRHCGRYCYYEINGLRYCQQREREAYPQAGYEIDDAAPGTGMK